MSVVAVSLKKKKNDEQVNIVQHRIIRQANRLLDFKTPQLKVTTLADIPSGTRMDAFGSVTFFFSSRRRHTRSLRDWSSDVCSSDLARVRDDELLHHRRERQR